jgi:hypothetical protein
VGQVLRYFAIRDGVVSSVRNPKPFRFWEPTVDCKEIDDFFFVGLCRAAELALFEGQRELADKLDGFDIAILLQLTRAVKNL